MKLRSTQVVQVLLDTLFLNKNTKLQFPSVPHPPVGVQYPLHTPVRCWSYPNRKAPTGCPNRSKMAALANRIPTPRSANVSCFCFVLFLKLLS